MLNLIKKTWAGLSAAVLGLAVSGCATTSYPEAPAMWVVRDADSTVYLLGTVHVLKPETQWRDVRIETAMAQSTELWLEMIAPTDPDEAALVMMPLMMRHGLSPGRPLSSLLTEDEQEALARAIQAAGMAEMAPMMEIMKPWVPAMLLSTAPVTQAGYDGAYGVETVLTEIALREGDAIKGLETMEQQLRFFAEMSEDLQLDFLRSALENQDIAELDNMVDGWARGRTTAPSREMRKLKAQEPELHEVLLSTRNEDWAGQIETLLSGSGVSFVAVGAGHFEGPDNLVERLKARGIEAARM